MKYILAAATLLVFNFAFANAPSDAPACDTTSDSHAVILNDKISAQVFENLQIFLVDKGFPLDTRTFQATVRLGYSFNFQGTVNTVSGQTLSLKNKSGNAQAKTVADEWYADGSAKNARCVFFPLDYIFGKNIEIEVKNEATGKVVTTIQLEEVELYRIQ